MATVHVIGAGISGLAAATALAERGVPVKLYEAASSAGGRTRSSTDRTLGPIDHGLHIFSGAAQELQRFIARVGAKDRFTRLPAHLPLWNGADGSQHRLSLRAPLPNASLADMAMLAGHVLHAPPAMMAHELLPEHSPLLDGWLSPLARLALTSAAHDLPVRSLRRFLRQQLGRGMGTLYMAKQSLGHAFIEPALQQLEYQGGSVYFGQALKSVSFGDDGPQALTFARKKLELMPGDVLILATPPAVAQSILPALAVPEDTHCAITLHYAVAHREAEGSVRVLANAPADLLRYDAGCIRASLRLADHAWHGDEAMLAARVWHMLQKLHPYLAGHDLPHYASWREKRAGHVLQPAPLPAPALPPRTLLAGDWLDATRPGTLDGAAGSGHRAAAQALALLGKFPEPSQYDFYLN